MKWNCFYVYLVAICILATVGIILNVRLISSCSQLLPHDVKISVKVALSENNTTDSLDLECDEEINITEDEVLSRPIHFWKDDWQTIWNSRKSLFSSTEVNRDSQIIKDVNSVFYSSNLHYSSIKVVKGVFGVRLLALTNVCYDIYHKSTFIYSNDVDYIKNKQIPEAFPPKSWNFEVQQSSIPTNAYWFDEEGIYIPMSHSNRNIAHFTEVFNFVYHYLHHKTLYPSIHSLFFLQYQKDVIYPWILSYIDSTKSLFTSEELFKTYFLEDLWKLDENGMICFKKAIGIGRISSYFYGGVYTSIAEADTVRSTAYKYYKIPIEKHSLTRPSVLVILREPVHGNLPGRGIVNVEEVRRFFKTNRQWYDFSEEKLELLSPNKQIETLSNTDVFIGVLGSGFANVIFMLPGSVAISYSPPNVGGFFFNTVSEFARVRYIGVYNSSIPFPPECRNRVNANGESTVRSCLDLLYAENVYMEIEQLKSLLAVAVIHLKSVKYK